MPVRNPGSEAQSLLSPYPVRGVVWEGRSDHAGRIDGLESDDLQDGSPYNAAMEPEQVFIGGATAGLCLIGIWQNRWFLEHTRKGRRLADWFGTRRAAWVLRGLFALGAVLGTLLATGVINPVRW